jgi:hypothetical protein
VKARANVSKAADVTCPKCHARPGGRCTIVWESETIYMRTPCEERIAAAEQKRRP